MTDDWKLLCTECCVIQDTTSAVCKCSCHKLLDSMNEFAPNPLKWTR